MGVVPFQPFATRFLYKNLVEVLRKDSTFGRLGKLVPWSIDVLDDSRFYHTHSKNQGNFTKKYNQGILTQVLRPKYYLLFFGWVYHVLSFHLFLDTLIRHSQAFFFCPLLFCLPKMSLFLAIMLTQLFSAEDFTNVRAVIIDFIINFIIIEWSNYY